MNHNTTRRNLRIVSAMSDGIAMPDGTAAKEIATSIAVKTARMIPMTMYCELSG
jgi:hypothetical protein